MSGDLFPDPNLCGWEEPECRYCGKPVVWAAITKEDGEPGRVPLDPKPPVYLVTKDGVGRRVAQGREGEKRVLVSHFATCTRIPAKGQR